MTNRERFLAACKRLPVDRTPIWLMRQAGRYLPEYRALKEEHGFLTMVKTPELAAEVTMQPLRRFDFDAAILFSDILVVPEAMGQPYQFHERGGIAMQYAIEERGQVEQLTTVHAVEKLRYVEEALKLLKQELGGKNALLGFGGSPWTLATYMIEGGSSARFQKIKEMFFTDRLLFDELMEKITAVLIDFFHMQANAGLDAIQIFDSWGGICAGHLYEQCSLQWIRRIVDEMAGKVPVILFAKGLHHRLDELTRTGADVISVDWTIDMNDLRQKAPETVALQGNLDPVILNTRPDIVRSEASHILKAMQGRPGHIFNLGHGIFPTARIENVEALVETVHSFPQED